MFCELASGHPTKLEYSTFSLAKIPHKLNPEIHFAIFWMGNFFGTNVES
jgi:hypothetical protein